MLGALSQALPTVSLPMGADQLLNAERLRALGLGLTLPADTSGVDQVRDALASVLWSPAVRQNLAAIRRDLRALPGPDVAVRAVAELVPPMRTDVVATPGSP